MKIEYVLDQLMVASSSGDMKRAETMISAGKQLYQKSGIGSWFSPYSEPSWYRAACIAATHGYLDVIKLLESAGVDVISGVDPSDRPTTAITNAIRGYDKGGHPEIIKYLVSNGIRTIEALDTIVSSTDQEPVKNILLGRIERIKFTHRMAFNGHELLYGSPGLEILRYLLSEVTVSPPEIFLEHLKAKFKIEQLPESNKELLTILDMILVNKE